jgi:hypothetical protein
VIDLAIQMDIEKVIENFKGIFPELFSKKDEKKEKKEKEEKEKKEKEKKEKEEKKAKKEKKEKDKVLISGPSEVKHQLHVDQDLKWEGNTDLASMFEFEKKVGEGYTT